jgi:chromosome partitioning protein
MEFITITGHKGGVGKTMTAIHLATFFSEWGRTLLVDGDPNRTALSWQLRGRLPFEVLDEARFFQEGSAADYTVIDTPARPATEDLQDLAANCDQLVLPTVPDILSLEPMLEVARQVGNASYRALIAMAPPRPNQEGELMRQELRDNGVPVFKAMIRRTVGFQKAALAGIPIRDLPDSRQRVAWNDYKAVGNEVMEALQ